MLFSKPKDVTYTQMAITIDNMVYSDNCDDELIYKYLYLLIHMLARKSNYFKTPKQYDEYSIITASYVFFRLKSPKQFGNNPKLTKIKSSLNYIKSVLYPRKVEFEKEFYSQTEIFVDDLDDETGYTFSNQLSDIANDLIKVEFKCCLENISVVVREYLKNIPYVYKSSEWYNIYISCLLTLLNSITMSRKDIEWLNGLKLKADNAQTLFEYYDSNKDNVILYHLSDTMKNYIILLTRSLKHVIAEDLSNLLNEDIGLSDVNDIFIKKELNNYGKDKY